MNHTVPMRLFTLYRNIQGRVKTREKGMIIFLGFFLLEISTSQPMAEYAECLNEQPIDEVTDQLVRASKGSYC